MKDHLDIQGHNEAIGFLHSIIKEERPFSEADIRALHKMLLIDPYTVDAQTADGKASKKVIKVGEYKTTPNHVETITGEIHYYATPEETPAKMQELMAWYSEVSANKAIHPIVVAALFHHKFVEIHPFDDGNGRVSRMLMNLILMRNHYPPAIIKNTDKQNYYALLIRADVGDSFPFIEYIAERTASSLQLYLKAINHDDIDEDEDIDKQIALYKIELLNKINAKEIRTNTVIKEILITQIQPLVKKLISKVNQFSDFFLILTHDVLINNFSVNSINEYIDIIDEQTLEKRLLDLQKVTLYFNFNKFKRVDNDFNVTIYLQVVFETYSYKILSFFGSNELVNKLYPEKLTKKDEEIIIKSVVDDLKNQIDTLLKSPNSD